MASIHESPPMTLEEFLALEDEKPYKEFIDGRIEVKVSPQFHHCVIQSRLVTILNNYALTRRLGLAVAEFRCNFDGRSIVPDVVFITEPALRNEPTTGELPNGFWGAPELMVEVLSPDQSRAKLRSKLAHAAANGCSLGWFVDPDRRVVEVYRPGGPPVALKSGDVLIGDPVLPGFMLPVAEIFSWLSH